MVPSSRLIWILAGVGFPASLAATVLPGAWAVVGIVFVAALIDALMRKRVVAGIGVELPPLLRLAQGRPTEIPVRISNAGRKQRRIRVALCVPRQMQAEPEDQWLELPAGSLHSEVPWRCLPLARGTCRIDQCLIEAPSLLGLWSVRSRVPTSLEVRIYPNLRDDRSLSALRQGLLNRHVVRQIGRGREFEKLREYNPGDGSDEIHWKASARRARPITKVFQIERTQEVYVVIDASRLSVRETGGESALELGIKAALTLNAVTERRGDLFGVAAFSSRMEAFVRARRGKTHYAACRDAINELQPKPVSPDFEEVSVFLRTRLQRRALILFLTSLDDPVLAEHFARSTKLLAQRHVVIAGMLRPHSARPLFSDDSATDVYGALAGHLSWHHLREVQRTLARQGASLALLEPDSFAANLVRLYDDVKQRQML